MSKANGKGNRFIEFLSLSSPLPSEAIAGDLRIELRGRNLLFVQGCKRIISYSPTLVCLSVKGAVTAVTGEGLVCSSYHAGTVSVEGRINSVSFGDEEGSK